MFLLFSCTNLFFFFSLLLFSQQRSIQTYFPEIHSWEGSLFDSSNNVILNFVLKIYDQSKYELSLSLYCRFPYFLPCLCISFFAAVVMIFCFWLPVRISFVPTIFCFHSRFGEMKNLIFHIAKLTVCIGTY